MGKGWLSPWAIWDGVSYHWKSNDATPDWQFPVRNGYVPVLQNDDVYIKHNSHFNKILVASATYIRAGEDLSAAKPITFTINAQPDVPRNISWAFVSHAQITAYTLVITGVDAKGVVITDTFTAASGWSGATAKAYATITSIILTTRTGTGAGDTMNVGIGSILGLENNIDAAGDIIKVTKSLVAVNAFAANLPAASFTVNATYDTVDVSTAGAIANGDSYTVLYKSRLWTQS